MNKIEELYGEWQSLQPLKKEDQKRLDDKFRMEFNYNSNHLEGNTLSYSETKLLLFFDQVKADHEMRELEEMKAHDVALNFVKQEAEKKDKPLTERFIKELNEIILVKDFWKDAITPEGQNTRRKIKVGQYKEYPNSVIQSNGEIFEYASPTETPALMAELVQWYNAEVDKGELSPIELAALLHYRYIRIHPFDDGNGRVARLLVNYVLFRYGYPPVVIKSDDKKNYLRALQQADAGDLQAFVIYMAQQLAWSLNICIRAAKGESIEEQDDWEKQLSLLKKELGDKGEKAIVKSMESINNVLQKSFVPFAEVFDRKIGQFDTLFVYKKIGFKFNNIQLRWNNIKEGLLDLLDSSIEDLEYVLIYIEYENFRHPYISVFVNTEPFSIVFYDDIYIIRYENNETIIKQYHQFLSDDEINEIVSAIAKDLLQKIENLKNNNQ